METYINNSHSLIAMDFFRKDSCHIDYVADVYTLAVNTGSRYVYQAVSTSYEKIMNCARRLAELNVYNVMLSDNALWRLGSSRVKELTDTLVGNEENI